MAAHSKLAHMMALTCFPRKPGRYQKIPPPDKAPDNRGGVENRAPVKQPRYSTPPHIDTSTLPIDPSSLNLLVIKKVPHTPPM